MTCQEFRLLTAPISLAAPMHPTVARQPAVLSLPLLPSTPRRANRRLAPLPR